jgi:hypothetical protein
MDEDQLLLRPLDPPPPVELSPTKLILARLDQLPTRGDPWRAVLIGMTGGPAGLGEFGGGEFGLTFEGIRGREERVR